MHIAFVIMGGQRLVDHRVTGGLQCRRLNDCVVYLMLITIASILIWCAGAIFEHKVDYT